MPKRTHSSPRHTGCDVALEVLTDVDDPRVLTDEALVDDPELLEVLTDVDEPLVATDVLDPPVQVKQGVVIVPTQCWPYDAQTSVPN